MGLFILTKTPGPLDIWMERENEKGEREKEEWEEADGIYSPKPSVIQSVPHDLKQKLILYQRIPQGYHMIGSINLAFITLSWKKCFFEDFHLVTVYSCSLYVRFCARLIVFQAVSCSVEIILILIKQLVVSPGNDTLQMQLFITSLTSNYISTF